MSIIESSRWVSGELALKKWISIFRFVSLFFIPEQIWPYPGKKRQGLGLI